MLISIQLIPFGQSCGYVTNISQKSLTYQAFSDIYIISINTFVP